MWYLTSRLKSQPGQDYDNFIPQGEQTTEGGGRGRFINLKLGLYIKKYGNLWKTSGNQNIENIALFFVYGYVLRRGAYVGWGLLL